jgi:DNA-binding NtrC family response regulator
MTNQDNEVVNDRIQQVSEEKKAAILMVDDEESLRTLYARICKKRGHLLEGAENVEEALQLLSRQSFDVILMDMNLQWMNGIQALQMIRDAGFSTPAIVFSCLVGYEDLESMQPLGVVGVMDKSFNNDALFELINRQVDKRTTD